MNGAYEGIPSVDRQRLAVHAEVSEAIGRAARAVRTDPALGRLLAERAPAVANLVPDIIRVAMGTLVPIICDQYEADLAALRERIAADAIAVSPPAGLAPVTDEISEEMVLAARSTIHVASGKRLGADVVRLALTAALGRPGGESRG